jgi:pimeloyl-ACP methyl ester carboxylesterase
MKEKRENLIRPSETGGHGSRNNLKARLKGLDSGDRQTIVDGRQVMVDGLNIHYKQVGQGHPVVLVHGGGNDWHEWKKNLGFLAQTFQVYALDLPGFGLSQSPEFPVSLFWYVEILKKFLENLKIEKPHLIGHSMGGMLSIAFAARFAERIGKLVIVDASGLGHISPLGQILLTIFRVTDRWRGKRRGPRYLIGSSHDAWLVRDELAEIKNPVLVIWGRYDIYLPYTQAALAQKLLPDSQIHIFTGCGHAPQRGNPAKFNHLVRQFLSDKA